MSETQESKKRDFTPEEARAFWQDVRARAAEGDCDFRGIFFLKDPDSQYFKDAKFDGDADFRCAKLGLAGDFRHAKFGGAADFSSAEFGVVVNFESAEFDRPANFRYAKLGSLAVFTGAKFDGGACFTYAKFDGDAYFSNAKFGGAAHLGAKFGGAAFFGDANFDEAVDFRSAGFSKGAYFRHAKFSGPADLRSAGFSGNADFSHAKFNGFANFGSTEFAGSTYFPDVEFGGRASFWKAVFHQEATMRDAVCHGVFRLAPPDGWPRSTRRPFVLRGQGHDAYRMAKQSAADRGDYQLAGKYHYAEQSIRCTARWVSGWQRLRHPKIPESEKNRWARFKARCLQIVRGLSICVGALGEMVFARFLFAYGERVRGILAATALVIFGWSFIYYHSGIVVGRTAEGVSILTHGFRDCLYFSMVTFTTLGYGDMKPIEAIRIWAATEAMLGAFLMALFVVGMARKFTR